MVAEYDSLELPNGALRSEKLEHLSVEEIYEILQKKNPASRPELPTLWVVVAGGSKITPFPGTRLQDLLRVKAHHPQKKVFDEIRSFDLRQSMT